MKAVKVVALDSESIEFEGGIKLLSEHDQDCCESHYLDFSDLTMKDFEGLEFNLTEDTFFEKLEGYGIGLKPNKGFPIRIPGYGYNNGYYSDQLTLVLQIGTKRKEFDISECQDISG